MHQKSVIFVMIGTFWVKILVMNITFHFWCKWKKYCVVNVFYYVLKMSEETYYWRNRDVILNRAKVLL